MNEKPNYYAIIPANVRYDDDLSPNAKLLYGEITALCNEKGFCWATNKYFMDLYGISERTIQNLLKQLSDKNYIAIEINSNTFRRIYIDFTTPEKNCGGGAKKITGYPAKNCTHNNTENNKVNIYERINTQIFDYDWLNDSRS